MKNEAMQLRITYHLLSCDGYAGAYEGAEDHDNHSAPFMSTQGLGGHHSTPYREEPGDELTKYDHLLPPVL
jgi:hypothetical protein